MNDLLAVVPARAGSKGVPGKNKALIAGLPLIEYTIAALRRSNSVTGILLTTDDVDILQRYENDADIFSVNRPPSMAGDEAKTAPAIQHALDAWQQAGHIVPDALLLAQPTTPLRNAWDIDLAFELFQKNERLSLISVCKAEGIRHPSVMYRSGDGISGELYVEEGVGESRRQDHEVIYQRNGAIYLVSRDYFAATQRFRDETPCFYEMPWERSINIDSPADLVIAKALIESGQVTTDALTQ